jgi:hypothetical protein
VRAIEDEAAGALRPARRILPNVRKVGPASGLKVNPDSHHVPSTFLTFKDCHRQLVVNDTMLCIIKELASINAHILCQKGRNQMLLVTNPCRSSKPLRWAREQLTGVPNTYVNG